MPRSLSALLAALVVLAGACGTDSSGPQERVLPTLEAGGVVDGDPGVYRDVIASFRGEPVVVNFWATWCEPCKAEMPRLVEAARRYDGRVRFLGVNVEDAREEAEAFARRFGIPFPNLADPGGDIRRTERIVGLPTTQFYRADGELAFVHSGEIDDEALEGKIEELLRIGIPRRSPA